MNEEEDKVVDVMDLLAFMPSEMSAESNEAGLVELDGSSENNLNSRI